MEEWYFGYLKNAFIPRYLLTLYRVHRVYHISFYSHFVQNKQSFITKKYSLYIVGEVRGAEISELLTAYNSGHDGSMSTGHGNTARDMLLRMETMLLMGMDIPLSAIRRQIASGIDILVHLGRMRDKTRKVLEIAEITGFSEGEIETETLYAFEEDENSTKEHVSGRLVRKGALTHVEKLEAAGVGR